MTVTFPLLAIQNNAANNQQCKEMILNLNMYGRIADNSQQRKEMILNLNMYGRIASTSCQTLSKIQVCKY